MNQDPYQLTEQCAGRVERPDLTGGQSGAVLIVSPSGIQATLDSGEVVHLPLKRLRLSRAKDGALVATSAKAGCSAASTEDAFLRALEAAGGNDLANQVAALAGERVSTSSQEIFSCLLVLTLVGFLFWGVPKLFRKGVQSSVAALPYSVDRSLGEQAQDSMQGAGRELDDPVLRDAIQIMLDRLEPHCGSPTEDQDRQGEGWGYGDWGLEFRIVDNEVANAFALPGGFITIHSELIAQSTSPEQVAGVLAHEIAHVTRRHGLLRVAHSLGTMAAVSLLFGNLGGLESIALELFTLSQVNGYSQDMETDADDEGTRMLIAAGINPRGLADFFRSMEAEHGDVPDALSWASTHPQFNARIQALEQQLARASAAGELPAEWTPLNIDWEAVHAALPE